MNRIVNGETVEMTEAEIAEWQAEQASYNATAWSGYKAQAKVLLSESDLTILRCYENSVPVPAAWAMYRKDLRYIIGAATGDPAQPLPVKPAYPAGT